MTENPNIYQPTQSEPLSQSVKEVLEEWRKLIEVYKHPDHIVISIEEDELPLVDLNISFEWKG